MPLLRYTFVFESPRQFVNNEKHGWDDEDSQSLVIEADDESTAHAWDHNVSEAFLKRLFKEDRAVELPWTSSMAVLCA
jgi:hypothetical protein